MIIQQSTTQYKSFLYYAPVVLISGFVILVKLLIKLPKIQVLTWTKTVVFMWRVSTRSDKWFNHSRWSAMDWVRSPLLWIRRKECHNRRQLKENEFQTVRITDGDLFPVQCTPDKLSFISTAARRTCSSLSICSFSRSSSSCIIIRPSSGLTPPLLAILGHRHTPVI